MKQLLNEKTKTLKKTYESTAVGVSNKRLYGCILHVGDKQICVDEIYRTKKDAENAVAAKAVSELGLMEGIVGEVKVVFKNNTCEIKATDERLGKNKTTHQISGKVVVKEDKIIIDKDSSSDSDNDGISIKALEKVSKMERNIAIMNENKFQKDLKYDKFNNVGNPNKLEWSKIDNCIEESYYFNDYNYHMKLTLLGQDNNWTIRYNYDVEKISKFCCIIYDINKKIICSESIEMLGHTIIECENRLAKLVLIKHLRDVRKDYCDLLEHYLGKLKIDYRIRYKGTNYFVVVNGIEYDDMLAIKDVTNVCKNFIESFQIDSKNRYDTDNMIKFMENHKQIKIEIEKLKKEESEFKLKKMDRLKDEVKHLPVFKPIKKVEEPSAEMYAEQLKQFEKYKKPEESIFDWSEYDDEILF